MDPITTDDVGELLEEMRAGRRVILVAPTRHAARWWLDLMTERGAGRDAVVRRTHGSESIRRHAGGSILFGSVGSDWRGRSADTLFLDGEPTDVQLSALMPCLMSAAEPRVIRR